MTAWASRRAVATAIASSLLMTDVRYASLMSESGCSARVSASNSPACRAALIRFSIGAAFDTAKSAASSWVRESWGDPSEMPDVSTSRAGPGWT